MKKDNKIINCDVTACKYNDSECKNCTLNEIKISSSSDGKQANKKETICDSFEEKNSR